jgi:hypothetical protein
MRLDDQRTFGSAQKQKAPIKGAFVICFRRLLSWQRSEQQS